MGFKYGESKVLHSGATTKPIASSNVIKKKAVKVDKDQDFPLDSLYAGIPCLFYEEVGAAFQMRVLRVDPKCFFLFVMERDKAQVNLQGRIPQGVARAMIRASGILAIHGGKKAMDMAEKRGYSHDLMVEDSLLVIEYSTTNSAAEIRAEQMAAAAPEPVVQKSGLTEKLTEYGTGLATFFGGAKSPQPTSRKSQASKPPPPERSFAFVLAAPKQNLSTLLKSMLKSVDFEKQERAAAKLVQSGFRLRQQAAVLNAVKNNHVLDYIEHASKEELLNQILADEMEPFKFRLHFKSIRNASEDFVISAEDMKDATTMKEHSKAWAEHCGLSAVDEARVLFHLQEIQTFVDTMRKFDPVSLHYLFENKALMETLPKEELDPLQQDVNDQHGIFLGKNSDTRRHCGITRAGAVAFQNLIDLEVMYEKECKRIGHAPKQADVEAFAKGTVTGTQLNLVPDKPKPSKELTTETTGNMSVGGAGTENDGGKTTGGKRETKAFGKSPGGKAMELQDGPSEKKGISEAYNPEDALHEDEWKDFHAHEDREACPCLGKNGPCATGPECVVM